MDPANFGRWDGCPAPTLWFSALSLWPCSNSVLSTARLSVYLFLVIILFYRGGPIDSLGRARRGPYQYSNGNLYKGSGVQSLTYFTVGQIACRGELGFQPVFLWKRIALVTFKSHYLSLLASRL